MTARYLVTATGFLSQPYRPEIPGIDGFAGTTIHTADWDDSVDLSGKRVAIIGTGATAVQLIPELAKVAGDLTVYQRTPIWVVPKLDFDIPKPVQKLFAAVPLTQRMARWFNTATYELLISGILHYRQAKRWNLHRRPSALGVKHMRRQISDPLLREKLTPTYDFGCKRPTFSNDYYPAFTKPNVHLETTPIERFTSDGIVTTDGNETKIDVLVLATGFNIWDSNFPAIELIGREGRNLGKWWRENRFCAYEGVSVPKFPNYLSIASPYSYIGLSYFTTIEAHMRHIHRLFTEMRRRGATTFEVKDAANTRFLDRMTKRLGASVFYAGSCATANSYYFNQHGEAAILRPTSTISARREASTFPLDDYSYAA
jgi:cation diffusion facilitator CzcD-associated flavoprotein CzcO